MYLVIELVKIVNPDSAIAPLVKNPKNVMQNGITMPPPPIPATVDTDMIIINRISPRNSIPKIGKTSLC